MELVRSDTISCSECCVKLFVVDVIDLKVILLCWYFSLQCWSRENRNHYSGRCLSSNGCSRRSCGCTWVIAADKGTTSQHGGQFGVYHLHSHVPVRNCCVTEKYIKLYDHICGGRTGLTTVESIYKIVVAGWNYLHRINNKRLWWWNRKVSTRIVVTGLKLLLQN